MDRAHRGEGVCSDCHRDLLLRVLIPTQSSNRPRSHQQKIVRHRRVDSLHDHVQGFLGAHDEGIDPLPPVEEFTAPVYNQVHQEQMVAWDVPLNIVENPAVCVAHSAPRRLRSASHHSSFDLAARDLTENMMRSSPRAVLFHFHRRV